MAGIRANVDLNVNTNAAKRSMERAAAEINKIVNNVSGKNVAFNVNGKSFTQPLGRITASANEFTKSLEASNARVIAFGASVGIINGITDSFKFLVAETVKFEKTLQDISVVLNSSNEQLQKFGQGLFDVAQNTAQSFNVAADAALEFSRQGLSVEEVLKRTNDALTLTRITSLDAAEAVAGLTAAVNAFGDAGLTTTDIIDKLAAVDVKFAVSSEDLINGLERAGAVAIDAGVSLDSLVGIITSLQQTTARGGAVIGNGLKTIFTRIQRPESLRQLEEMGIGVRSLTGAILPADKILQSIAKTFGNLTQAQQSNIVQFSAGIFQANIFRAALTDLAKSQGIQQQATEISSNAAGEAARKNELLNKSIAALTSQAGSGLRELVGIIGELSIKSDIGNFVGFFGERIEELKEALGGGEGEGSTFAKGLVRGIGNVLTGPGVVAFTAIFGKLLFNVFKFASSSLKDVLGIVTQKEKIRQIEQSIVQVLGSNIQVTQALNNLEGDRAAQEKFILGIIEQQTNALAKQQQLASNLARPLLRKGITPDLTFAGKNGQPVDLDGDGVFSASGLLPEQVKAERKGAIDGGYSPGTVSSMKVKGVGSVIYNKAETIKHFEGMKQPAIMPPKSSRAGKRYEKEFADKHGFNPYSSDGLIPNFVDISNDLTGSKGMHLRGTPFQNLPRKVINQIKQEDGSLGGGDIEFETKTASLKSSTFHKLGEYLEALGVNEIKTKIPFDFIDLPVNKKGKMTREVRKGLTSGVGKTKGNFAENLFLQSEEGQGFQSTSPDDQAVVDAVQKGRPPKEIKSASISLQNIFEKSIRRYSNTAFRNSVRSLANNFLYDEKENPKLGTSNHEIASAIIGSINKIEEDSIVKNLNTLARMGEYSIDGMSQKEIMSSIYKGNFRKDLMNQGIGEREKNILMEYGMNDGLIPNFKNEESKTQKGYEAIQSAYEQNGKKFRPLNSEVVFPSGMASKQKGTANRIFVEKNKSDFIKNNWSLDKDNSKKWPEKGSSSWEKAVKFILHRSGSDPLSELTDEQIYKSIIDSDLSNEKGHSIAAMERHHKSDVLLTRWIPQWRNQAGFSKKPPESVIEEQSTPKSLQAFLADNPLDWVRYKGKGAHDGSKKFKGSNFSRIYPGAMEGHPGAFSGLRKPGPIKKEYLKDFEKSYFEYSQKRYVPSFDGDTLHSKIKWRKFLDQYNIEDTWDNYEKIVASSNKWGEKTRSAGHPLDFVNPPAEAKHYAKTENTSPAAMGGKLLRYKIGQAGSWENYKKGGDLGGLDAIVVGAAKGFIPNYIDYSKIEALAKRGIGGEKENAKRILKSRQIKSKNLFDDSIIDAFLENPNQEYPPGTPISEYLIKKGYDKEKILKAAKNPSDYKRASQGFVPNFAQKIRNGAIYHSKVNNKAVRVKRAHQAEQIAYIKHHGQDHLFESEVPFSDLSAATKEQIQEYLKQKSEGLVPNFQFENFGQEGRDYKEIYRKIKQAKNSGKLKNRIDFANISGMSEESVGTQVRSLESNDRAIESIGSNKIKELISIYQGITKSKPNYSKMYDDVKAAYANGKIQSNNDFLDVAKIISKSNISRFFKKPSKAVIEELGSNKINELSEIYNSSEKHGTEYDLIYKNITQAKKAGNLNTIKDLRLLTGKIDHKGLIKQIQKQGAVVKGKLNDGQIKELQDIFAGLAQAGRRDYGKIFEDIKRADMEGNISSFEDIRRLTGVTNVGTDLIRTKSVINELGPTKHGELSEILEKYAGARSTPASRLKEYNNIIKHHKLGLIKNRQDFASLVSNKQRPSQYLKSNLTISALGQDRVAELKNIYENAVQKTDWKNIYKKITQANKSGLITGRISLGKASGLHPSYISRSILNPPAGMSDQLTDAEVKTLQNIWKPIKHENMSGRQFLAGEKFEEIISELGGLKYVKDKSALDFSRAANRPLSIPNEVRESIGLRPGTKYGDAHAGKGHGLPYMRDKIIRELFDDNRLMAAFRGTSDIRIPGKTFVDVTAKGSDGTPSQSSVSTLGHIYKMSKTSLSAKKAIDETLSRKKITTAKQRQKEFSRNVVFDYHTDAVDLSKLSHDQPISDKISKFLSLSSSGYIPNFSKVTQAIQGQKNRVKGEKEYLGTKITKSEKGLAENLYDYFLSHIGGLSPSFSLHGETLSLRGTPEDYSKVSRHSKTEKNQQNLVKIAGGQRQLKKILDGYLLGHFSSILNAKKKFKIEEDPFKVGTLSQGLIPNFFNLNRKNLSDKDKMSDRQLLLKKWQDKMSQIAPYAKRIKQGGARAEIDPIISKLNAEANAIWDELQKLKKGKDYYIPNYADPLQEAIGREKSAGIPSSRIRVEKSSQLKSPMNPMGLAVTNTRDEPGGVAQGIRRAKQQRIDPKRHGAAKGLVPNFTSQSAYGAIDDAYDQQAKSLNKAKDAQDRQTESTDKNTQAEKENIKAVGDNLTKLFFFQSTLSMANGFLQEFAETGNNTTRSLASFGESVTNIAASFIQQKTLINEILEQTGQQGQGIGIGSLFGSMEKGTGGKKGPLSSLFKKFGPVVKGLGSLAKGFTRFLPLIGQAYTLFTIVNEGIKKFSGTLAKIEILGMRPFGFLEKLEEGEGIMDLFKSSADRAKSSLEKLSKKGELLASTLEQVTKLEATKKEIAELRAVGPKRTSKQDQALFNAEINLLDIEKDLEKKLNEAILNIKDKSFTSSIESQLNSGIDPSKLNELFQQALKKQRQEELAQTISAGFLDTAGKKGISFEERIAEPRLNLLGSKSIKALNQEQLKSAAQGDTSAIENMMPYLVKDLEKVSSNIYTFREAVMVAAKKQIETNNVINEIAEAAIDSKILLDKEYFLMSQKYQTELQRNSLAKEILNSEYKILDANQSILLEKKLLSQSQAIQNNFARKSETLDFDFAKKRDDARIKTLEKMQAATKETINFDFGPAVREGKTTIPDQINSIDLGKAANILEMSFDESTIKRVQGLYKELASELESVRDNTSASVKMARKYKEIQEPMVAALFNAGLVQGNIFAEDTKTLEATREALFARESMLRELTVQQSLQTIALNEEKKRELISKQTSEGARILLATILKQGNIAQQQEVYAANELENRKGILDNLIVQNKISENNLEKLKDSGVLLVEAYQKQIEKNRKDAESGEISFNQNVAQLGILTLLDKENKIRKEAEDTLTNKFKNEIVSAQLAAAEAELREEFFNDQSNLNELAQAQVNSEQANARVSANLALEKLKILTNTKNLAEEIEVQLKNEITSAQKSALLTASKALLLSKNKKQAELLDKANTLQELSNKYTEAENAIRKASISRAENSMLVGLDLVTEKAQSVSDTRTAGERALQTRDPRDMLAYAEKLKETNRLFGKGTQAIDQFRIKMAEMANAAYNLKADLVDIAIEDLRTNMVQMFKDIGSGAKSVGEAYKDLGLGLAEKLLDRMMQHNVDKIISNLTYAFTGVDGNPGEKAIVDSNQMLSSSLQKVATSMGKYATQVEQSQQNLIESINNRDSVPQDQVNNNFDLNSGMQASFSAMIEQSQSFYRTMEEGVASKIQQIALKSEDEVTSVKNNFSERSTEVLENFKMSAKSMGDELHSAIKNAIDKTIEYAKGKELIKPEGEPVLETKVTEKNKTKETKSPTSVSEEKLNSMTKSEVVIRTRKLQASKQALDEEIKRLQRAKADHSGDESLQQLKNRRSQVQSELVQIAKHSETLGMEMNSVDSQILQKKRQQLSSSQGKIPTFDVEDPKSVKKSKRNFWGGKIQHFAKGGLVEGPAGIDNVPAMLTAGEYVVPKEEVQMYSSGGRIERFAKGATQAAVMTITADAVNRAMDDQSKKKGPPTFNMNTMNPLDLGSDLSLSTGDPRMSGRALAKSEKMQEYKDYLLEKAAYEVDKKNEKYQKRLGYLQTAMGFISSFAIGEVTDILKEPLRKAVDFVTSPVKKAGKYIGNKANDFIQGDLGAGEYADAYRQAKSAGYDLSYNQVKNSFETGQPIDITRNPGTKNAIKYTLDPTTSKAINFNKQKRRGIGPKGAYESSVRDSNSFRVINREVLDQRPFSEPTRPNSNNMEGSYRRRRKGFNSGGKVPSMLTSGEGFIPSSIAKKIGYHNLNSLNKTGSLPIVQGPQGIDKVGPVGLDEGDFIIRRSSTEKLMRENPNIMRFAMQNPDGFRKETQAYYEGGIVGTGTQSTGNYGTPSRQINKPESGNRIQNLLDRNQERATEKISSSNSETTNNISVNVTIDASGKESVEASSPESSYEKEQDLAMKIKSKVLEVIREEKRLGGELG